MTTKRVSDADLRALTDPAADPVDREAALRHVAHWEKGKYVHLEKTIAALFEDPVAMVRGAAVKALVGSWLLGDHLDEALGLLAADPDWSVRADAAFSVGSYGRYAGKARDRIAPALARAIRDDEDEGVHEAAYEQLVEMSGRERTWESGRFERDRHVDWAFVNSFLG